MKLFLLTMLLFCSSVFANTSLDINNRDVSKTAGFKIVSLDEGGVYKRLGLQKGDIIKAINGKPIRSPQDAGDLLTLMKTVDKIEIELVRDGATKKIFYQLK